MRRLTAAAGIVVLLIVGALAVASESGEGPPPDDGSYARFGIPPAAATELTGDKADLWRVEWDGHQTALARSPVPKLGRAGITPTTPPSPPPRGLIQRDHPIGKSSFQNVWFGYTSAGYVSVRAGWREGPGAVVWYRLQADREPYQEFEIPGDARTARLARVDGSKLTIVTDRGSRFVFDAETLTLGSDAPFASCCTLQVDVNQYEAGPQAAGGGRHNDTVRVSLVLGEHPSALSTIEFTVDYDGLKIANALPVEPVFRSFLGVGWTCSDRVAPSAPFVRGRVSVTCASADTSADIAETAVLGTLAFSVATPGDGALRISSARLLRADGAEIGACGEGTNETMTCVDGIFHGY